MEHAFVFGDKLTARMDPSCGSPLLEELTRGFTCGKTSLSTEPGAPLQITIGAAEPLPLLPEDEYTLNVTGTGVAIAGKDRNSLLRGFLAFLSRIEPISPSPAVSMGVRQEEVHGSFRIAVRMAHLCVLPENTFHEIRKLIRLFGAFQYTHLILEFWGTCKFDCFPEYCWEEFCFSKEQIRLLVQEGKALGLEMIPQLNHLGHASASRLRSGKHVVLDRHPEFALYFTPDGWAWNYGDPRIVSLLKQMRQELYDLFDHPKYFHAGLDEAFIYSRGYISTDTLAGYLKDVVDSILAEGATPLLWADMVTPRSASKKDGGANTCAPEDDTAGKLLRAISPRAILCDWHYNTDQVPVETAVYLKALGRQVVGCAWQNRPNVNAYVDTAAEYGLTGAMLTTWHTLQGKMISIPIFAKRAGLPLPHWWQFAPDNGLAAAVLRLVSPKSDRYEDYGFAPTQLAPILS